ncbi:MAG: DUF559 domain-containing protein [Acidimicrobiales bacterium]
MHYQFVRRDVDAAIEKLAVPRAGAFHRDEVRAAGGNKWLVARRTRARAWHVQGDSDTFVLASLPPSLDQRRWVGLLAAGDGALLTHESAAELHRIESVVRGLVIVTTSHPLHLIVDGITFHQVGDVLPHHRTEIAGFPTTTPARTLFDLAAVVSVVRFKRAIEDAVVRRLVTFRELYEILRELRRRGKPGVRKMERALSMLDGKPPPASELERVLLRAAELAGVKVERQHPLPTRQPIKGCVDAAVVASKLILEADGRSWHARLEAMTRDRERDRDAARLGWQTLRFMYQDLKNDLEEDARAIREVHQLRS